MNQPTLLSLPVEVRLNIYSYLFEDENIYIDPCVYDAYIPRRSQTQQQNGAALLRTCQQLRDEATVSYFSNVRVHFDMCKNVPTLGLMLWLSEIGEENIRLLRKFEMRWNGYVDIRLDLARYDARRNQIDLHDITSEECQSVESTRKTYIGAKHTLSVQGVPEHEPEYWKRMGTSNFCDVLARQLSISLEKILMERQRPCLTVQEVLGFAIEADEHASALRWLWVW